MSSSAEIDEETAEWPSGLVRRSMPSDDSQSIDKRLEPQQQKGYSTDAISVAIARDVLRRVREGTLPSRESNPESL